MPELLFFPMDEQRKLRRSRTLKGGTISLNRGGVIDCTIRNLSNAGACLEVATPVGIPDDFILVTKPDRIKHPCHVAWRSKNQIGVVFK
jgi:hypothetical protein